MNVYVLALRRILCCKLRKVQGVSCGRAGASRLAGVAITIMNRTNCDIAGEINYLNTYIGCGCEGKLEVQEWEKHCEPPGSS